jgi:hypothetical protein
MKFQQSCSKGKVEFRVCFTWQGIVYREFIPNVAIVSKERYKEIHISGRQFV